MLNESFASVWPLLLRGPCFRFAYACVWHFKFVVMNVAYYTKRNETKQKDSKRNERKRNEPKRNETQRNVTKGIETKRNENETKY